MMQTYTEWVKAPTWMFALMYGAIILVGVVMVTNFVKGGTHGSESLIFYPAMVATMVVLIAVTRYFMYLRIQVDQTRLRFGFGPFGKTVPLHEISSAEVQRYNWRAYGGWGIRYSFGGKRAYSLPGVGRGVVVAITRGDSTTRYFVSSNRPEELAAALAVHE